MTTVVDTQIRKTGDTLRLSGEFAGGTIPTDPTDWIGATAKINIVHSDTRVVWRSVVCPLDVAAAPFRYAYEGLPTVDADEGTYEYEIEVTFADTTITTFPGTSAYKFKLKLIAQLG